MASADANAPPDLLAALAPPVAAQPDARVTVLLPLPFDEAFDYAVPRGLALAPGDLVEVPLGGRLVPGVVWDEDGAGRPIPQERLKLVRRRLDVPPFPPAHRRFLDRAAAYTLTRRGAMLRLALGRHALDEVDRRSGALVPTGAAPPPGFRLTPARARVLALAETGPARPAAELAAEAAAGPAVVRALVAAGLLAAVPLPGPGEILFGADRAARLSADQAAALAALTEALDVAATGTVPPPLLIDGVTGSGKTAVYLEAVAEAVARGRQALVLLPEIALTAQVLDRFAERFGAEPATWHSEMSDARRRQVWQGVAAGRARVVVGARSALFLPFPALGLVVVDEEHDGAFKQEDGVCYHARDMAVLRAHTERVPVVLVSATPSLESASNAARGRYRRLHLPERHGGALLPAVTLVDLRRQRRPARRWIAPPLAAAITETLDAGEQVLLFLNRRGYAPLTLCGHCGHRLRCPNCTAWLVEHRLTRSLQCHHCGHCEPAVERCPACGTEGGMIPCGPGVERLEEEVAASFPTARRLVLASDSLAGPEALKAAIRRIAAHEVDLIIGTQIVAKGHHFPMLTLVGVVDADLGLAGGDLRAAERSFQLLHQVAGRAGRADRPGRVLIQSFEPEHRVMQALAAQDGEGFRAVELAERAAVGAPPFRRWAALIVSAPEEAAADAAAAALAAAAPRRPGLEVLGPAPAPLALLRGRHRRRLLVQADRALPLQAELAAWIAAVRLPAAARLQVDIDPMSFL